MATSEAATEGMEHGHDESGWQVGPDSVYGVWTETATERARVAGLDENLSTPARVPRACEAPSRASARFAYALFARAVELVGAEAGDDLTVTLTKGDFLSLTNERTRTRAMVGPIT
jgi:hypothetical protein